jgi:hypothetical protein
MKGSRRWLILHSIYGPLNPLNATTKPLSDRIPLIWRRAYIHWIAIQQWDRIPSYYIGPIETSNRINPDLDQWHSIVSGGLITSIGQRFSTRSTRFYTRTFISTTTQYILYMTLHNWNLHGCNRANRKNTHNI